MKATLALIALAVGTYALKSAGPLALGGRELRKSISRVATLLPAALLAALVVVATFSNGRSLTLDARAAARISSVGTVDPHGKHHDEGALVVAGVGGDRVRIV